MEWAKICEDKTLQDLPYKIEQNEWGHLVMSPASNRHGLLQTLISYVLMQHKTDGLVLTECSVETSKGVKVADVAWGSSAFFSQHKLQTPYEQAPEICVEIISPSNSLDELRDKIDLYLARGAKEVWLCDEEAHIQFHTYRGRIQTSGVFTQFPSRIELELPS